jgi:hypothetical protein
LRLPARTQLGQVERRVFLALADREVPTPATASRSAREVLRRALLRLAELRLIVAGDVPRLTSLGRQVTRQFRRELEEGRRIRW